MQRSQIYRSICNSLCAALASGCASTQLNYNTLDLAESLDGVVTRQVLFNLEKTLVDPYAVPSQVMFSAGTATTSNAINPTIIDPLTKSVAVTNSLGTSATQTITNSIASTTANKSWSVGLNDQWTQSWTPGPITDPDELRRLRTLYRYAAGHIKTENAFLCEYPIQTAAEQAPSGGGKTEGPAKFTLTCEKEDKTDVKVDVSADPQFLNTPTCVICADLRTYGIGKTGRPLPPKLNRRLRTGWIHSVPSEGMISMIAYGYPNLLICKSATEPCRQDGIKEFHEFVLFIFEATSGATSSSTSSKTPSVKTLAAPVLIAPPF
jgi:hypothetical protein